MKDTQIKLLATSLIENEIDKKIAERILKLQKRDLKKLLFYLKKQIDEKKVYVLSAEELDSNTVKELRKIFTGKEIVEETDKTAIGGLKIRQKDIILDMTIKNTIEQTIKKLENSL